MQHAHEFALHLRAPERVRRVRADHGFASKHRTPSKLRACAKRVLQSLDPSKLMRPNVARTALDGAHGWRTAAAIVPALQHTDSHVVSRTTAQSESVRLGRDLSPNAATERTAHA